MFKSFRTWPWLLPLIAFFVMIAYLPGVMSVSTVGRWAVITLVGLPVLLGNLHRVKLSLTTVLFGWATVGLYWSVSPWDTAGALLHWSALAGTAMLAMATERRELVWIALAVGVSLQLPVVVLQVMGFHPVQSVSMAGFPGNVGLFLSSNVLTEVSVVVVVLMLAKRQWLLAVPAMICVMLAGRNEAVLMLVVAGVFAPGTSTRLKLVCLLGICAAVVALALVDSDLVQAHWLTTVNSMVQRYQVWYDTLTNSDLLGVGLGTYGAAFPFYGFAHNELIQLNFELGLPGVCLVTCLVTYAILSRRTNINTGEAAALLVLAASSLVWAPLQDPATAFIVAVLVGGLLGDRYRADWLATVQRVRHATRVAPFLPRASGTVRPVGGGHGALAVGQEHPARG